MCEGEGVRVHGHPNAIVGSGPPPAAPWEITPAACPRNLLLAATSDRRATACLAAGGTVRWRGRRPAGPREAQPAARQPPPPALTPSPPAGSQGRVGVPFPRAAVGALTRRSQTRCPQATPGRGRYRAEKPARGGAGREAAPASAASRLRCRRGLAVAKRPGDARPGPAVASGHGERRQPLHRLGAGRAPLGRWLRRPRGQRGEQGAGGRSERGAAAGEGEESASRAAALQGSRGGR